VPILAPRAFLRAPLVFDTASGRSPLSFVQQKRRAESRRREEEDARREAERAAAGPGSSGSGDSGGATAPDSNRKRRPERRDTEMEGRKGAAAAMSTLGDVGKDEGELLAQIEKERSNWKETRMQESLRPANVRTPRCRLPPPSVCPSPSLSRSADCRPMHKYA
jgi:hypothetical protein